MSAFRLTAITGFAMSLVAGCEPVDGPLEVRAEGPRRTDAAGAYASVNGLKMYYEIRGEGEPLVLLHGAFGWRWTFRRWRRIGG